jgi:hypothetical protein
MSSVSTNIKLYIAYDGISFNVKWNVIINVMLSQSSKKTY